MTDRIAHGTLLNVMYECMIHKTCVWESGGEGVWGKMNTCKYV